MINDFAQPADCNPQPEPLEWINMDDHPDSLSRCADCGKEFTLDRLRVWAGTAYICGECDRKANELPFEEDE